MNTSRLTKSSVRAALVAALFLAGLTCPTFGQASNSAPSTPPPRPPPPTNEVRVVTSQVAAVRG